MVRDARPGGGRGRDEGAREESRPEAAHRGRQRPPCAADGERRRADEAHAAEFSDDPAHRDEGDKASTEVGAALVELRELVEATAGVRGLADLGLSDAVPRDAVARERVALRVLELGGAGGFKLRPRKGVSVDVDVFIDALRPQTSRLTSALARVRAEDAEAQGTQAAKDSAVEAFDAAFVAASDVLYGLALLAGQRALGDRLPTLTRRRPAAGEATPETPAPA